MTRNYFFCAAISIALLMPNLARADVQPNTPALLSAGMFRLESERSYKLSLQMALGILPGHTEVERKLSLENIGRWRKQIQMQVKSSRTSTAFTRADRALSEQLTILPSLSAKNAATLYEVNEDTLVKMNSLSFAFEAEAQEQVARVTGLALRQASLAQRMAKIVLLRSVDKRLLERRGLEVDLAQTRIEFINGLALLAEQAQHSQALAQRLQIARQQWDFYDVALGEKQLNAESLRNISSTSDRIAQMMVEIVRLGYKLPPDPSIIAER